MNAVSKWTSDDFLKFLDVFQNYELLWNVTAADHMNRTKREKAYERFMKDLEQEGFTGLTVEILKKKIKAVKDIHRQEFNKVLKSKKSGCGTDDVYKPKLVWFDKADSFLKDVVAVRSTTSALDVSSLSQQNLYEEDNDEHNGTSSPPPVTRQPTTKKRSSKNQPPSTPPFKRLQPSSSVRTKYFESTVNKPHDYDLAHLTSVDMEDEYDKFAKHIAAQLRNLPTRNFVILQEKIQALVTAERLSCMQGVSPDTSSSVSTSPRHYSDSVC